MVGPSIGWCTIDAKGLPASMTTVTRDFAESGAAGELMQRQDVLHTYTTIDGEVIDLTALIDEERAFFGRCYRAFRDGTLRWAAMSDLVVSGENPVVRSAGGRVTVAVLAHPLYRAVHDLEHRVGLRTGELALEPEYDLAQDPLGGAGSQIAIPAR